MKSWATKLLLLSFSMQCASQIIETENFDTICGHETHWDERGRLLGWYQPRIPGAAFDHVARLASEFLLRIPDDPRTGMKMYLVTCCFQGPHMHAYPDEVAPGGIAPEDWMHNPACVNAGFVHSFALKYYQYTGDDRFKSMVGQMLDYQLRNGTTPAHWIWADVPYASSDPFEPVYAGATRWEEDGMRGDGLHGIEPDKVGELGYAYLKYYQLSKEPKYLEASIHCADALAGQVRSVNVDNSPLTITETVQSPWPFRVNAETGVIISEYCANVLEPIKLFNELLRLESDLGLLPGQAMAYRKARDFAWNWLYSKHGPLKTYIWSQYFEDVPNDPDRANRNQVTPMELAKYLMENPGLDPRMDIHVPALVHWVLSTFGDPAISAIREQTWCYESMGSHSSRFGSTCAMWSEYTGYEKYKELAYRYLNYATYMTYDNGVVAVGHQWPSSWFSDGYGDYVRHFFDAMAAIPEWAPADENHLLRSSSVVQTIDYGDQKIELTCYDLAGTMRFRLIREPQRIIVNGVELSTTKSEYGYYTSEILDDHSAVIDLSYASGNVIQIIL